MNSKGLESRILRLELAKRKTGERFVCFVDEIVGVMTISGLGFNGPIAEGRRLIDQDKGNSYIVFAGETDLVD